MKKRRIIYLIIFLLCTITTFSALYFGIDPTLNRMTDRELIQTVLDNDVAWNYAMSSYRHPLGDVYTLRKNSPEFHELLTRSTAIDSLKTFTTDNDTDQLELDMLLDWLNN